MTGDMLRNTYLSPLVTSVHSTFLDRTVLVPTGKFFPCRWVIPPKNSGTEKWNFLLKKDRKFEVKKSRYPEGQILAILKQALAMRWLWTYNHQRPNMALGGSTPMQTLG